MENPRIAFLEKNLQERPDEPFLRYALAIELANAGRHEEAWKHFEKLLAGHPEYAPAHYQAGVLLARLGRLGEARQVFSRGIEVTGRQGDAHALGELEAALDGLPGEG